MVPQLDPREVFQRLEAGSEVLLLDCREPEEWALARVEGATLIPMGDIPARLSELDPERETIVMCHHGVRSMAVASWLAGQDFERVYNMLGGIDLWSQLVDESVPRY